MFRSILPKEFQFFDYFEKHISLTNQAAAELVVIYDNPDRLLQSTARIKDLEAQADEITHVCSEALHKTFITPFERGDIYHLIKNLDDITDHIDAAVSRISLYEITEIRPETREMGEILVSATERIKEALTGLRDMKHSDLIRQKCISIHKLENDGDVVLRSAVTKLFKEGDAMNLIKWREIFNRLEKAVDNCEAVANIIEGVVIASA